MCCLWKCKSSIVLPVKLINSTFFLLWRWKRQGQFLMKYRTNASWWFESRWSVSNEDWKQCICVGLHNEVDGRFARVRWGQCQNIRNTSIRTLTVACKNNMARRKEKRLRKDLDKKHREVVGRRASKIMQRNRLRRYFQAFLVCFLLLLLPMLVCYFCITYSPIRLHFGQPLVPAQLQIVKDRRHTLS